jgi:Prp8 binding protein
LHSVTPKKLWDIRKKHAVKVIETDLPLTSVCFNDAGDQVFAGSVDNQITAWDLRAMQPTMQLQGHNDTITGIRLSPDGTQLVSNAMDHTVRVWDVKPFSTVPMRMLSVLTGAPHSMDRNLIRPCWSPDGNQVACGSADRSVVVWDLVAKKMTYKLPGHKGTVNQVDWHSNEPIREFLIVAF